MGKSLRAELLQSHLILVGLMLVVMLVAVAGFFRLGRSVDRILRDNYKSVVAAQNMKESLERMDSAATFYLSGQAAQARTQYRANRPLFEAAYAVEATNITEQGEQAISDDIGARYQRYRTGLDRLLSPTTPLPGTEAKRLYFTTLQPQFAELKRRAQDVLDLNQRAIVRADQRARTEARNAALVSGAITAAALLLGLGVARRNINALMMPLVSVTRQASEIGAGHLNQRIEVRRTDEIGLLARTFNEMAERLREARRLAEERLHRAERMSDAALENLYDPVVVTDAAGNIVHLNRAAEGLFGPEPRAQGKPVRYVVREPRLAAAIERAVGEERVSAEEGEAALIAFSSGGNAESRVYRLRANPMRDDNNVHLGAVAVLEDVTYQQEVDRLKNEFIGVASHELRTPVTSLLLGIELLREGAVGALSPAQQEVVRVLEEDLHRLERMMRDLLDLTRLEAGATPPRFEVVRAADLVAQATAALKTQAQAKDILLSGRAATDLPPVRADRGQIARVLLNLITNALRHTPGGGSVVVTAEQDPAEPTRYVRFYVRDSGGGIPAEYLGRVFDRFVQVPGATRGGSGLGLSLAQTIVAAHGGTIKAYSAGKDQGSEFTFTLQSAADSEASGDGAGRESE